MDKLGRSPRGVLPDLAESHRRFNDEEPRMRLVGRIYRLREGEPAGHRDHGNPVAVIDLAERVGGRWLCGSLVGGRRRSGPSSAASWWPNVLLLRHGSSPTPTLPHPHLPLRIGRYCRCPSRPQDWSMPSRSSWLPPPRGRVAGRPRSSSTSSLRAPNAAAAGFRAGRADHEWPQRWAFTSSPTPGPLSSSGPSSHA